jgi:hypothetical protein
VPFPRLAPQSAVSGAPRSESDLNVPSADHVRRLRLHVSGHSIRTNAKTITDDE